MRATQFVFLFLIARLSALPTTQGTAPSTSKYPPPVSAVRQPDAPKAPQLKSAATQSGNDGNNMILNQKSLTSPVKIQQQSKSSGKNETNVLKLQSTSDKGLEEILKGTATDNLRTKAKNGENGKNGTSKDPNGQNGGNVTNEVFIKSQAANKADLLAQQKLFEKYNPRNTLIDIGKDKGVGNAGNGGAGYQGNHAGNGGQGGSANNEMRAQISEGKVTVRGVANFKTGQWSWTKKM